MIDTTGHYRWVDILPKMLPSYYRAPGHNNVWFDAYSSDEMRAYAIAAYQRGIEDAIKAVPKDKMVVHRSVYYTEGWNECRAETLWKLGELK